MKKNKKKILFLITKSEIGGAQKWVKEQIEILQDLFELYLATNKNGWLVQNSKVISCLLNDKIEKRFSIKYITILYRFIKLHKIDLIIANSANAGVYARLIKVLNPKLKVIYVSHGWSSIYNGGKLRFLYIKIEKLLSFLTDSILCVSSTDYQNAKDIININKNKLQLISNKIFPLITKKDFTLKDKIKLLTVSRLSHPKRVDILIEAFNSMYRANYELHIIGDGPLRNKLETIAKDNIFFHGAIDNFTQFHQYEIFILISESEGLPLSALEAMSAGMPLILSNVGGCHELIKNNGVLVQNNINNIKNAINICTENYKKMANESLILFKNFYDLKKFSKEYIKYYNTVLEK